MFVFSNRRLGAVAEVLVPQAVAASMLRAVASAVLEEATGYWERELGRWLLTQAAAADARPPGSAGLDVADLAWSPDHFATQQKFVLAAIARVDQGHDPTRWGRALPRWAELIQAHPRAFVQAGRRWNWQPTA